MRELIFTSLFLLSLIFGLQAQTLATFEDEANDLAVFGTNDTGGGGFWFDSGRFVDGGQPQVGSNPAVGGINLSNKCLLAINAATFVTYDSDGNQVVTGGDWWGNFCSIGLATPITITEANRYLHFMAYRSIQPKNFRVNVNGTADGGNAGGNTEIWNGKLKNDATWENVVVDLGVLIEKGEPLSVISFVLSNNWDDPRGDWGVATYAFDNFALSNSSLPPDVTLINGNDLHIGFESQAETDLWVKEIDLINAGNSKEIISNPFTESAVNAQGKVLKFDKSVDASWWQGCRFDFNGIMAAGGTDNPQYLHVMVYVPQTVLEQDMISIDIQLCAKDHLGNENIELFTVWDDEMDEWIDLVMEINQIDYLKELTVRFDLRKDADDNYINSPANTYYLDDIVFNKDSESREKIETGIKQIAGSPLANITDSNGIIYIKANQNAQIQVYDVVGKLVASNKTVVAAEKGVYIVNVTSGNEKQTAKILVK
jgi:hypothetical protein